MPAVRFDGSDDYMTLGNPFSIDNNCTVFCVFAPSDSATRRTLFGQNNAANAFQLEYNDATSKTRPTRGSIISGTFVSYVQNLELDPYSTVEMLTYIRNGSGANHTIRNRQVEQTLHTNATNSYSGDGTKDIGRRASASQHFLGDMFALAIYDRTLNSTEILQVEEYFEKYYDIADVQFLNKGTVNLSAGSGNAQGVAYDGTNYYFIRSNTIAKYTRSGNVYTISGSAVTIDSSLTTGRTQINGGNYYDGFLWIGGNNYDTVPRVGWILKVDPSDLSVSAVYSTEAHHCEGGAWHDVGDGDEFWAVYNDTDIVSRYDSSFTLVDSYSLELGEGREFGYQGAAWIDDYLLTPVHVTNSPDHTIDVHRWNGSGFVGVAQLATPTLACGQGIHWEKTTAAAIGDVLLCVERSDNRIVRAQYNYVPPAIFQASWVRKQSQIFGGGVS